MVSWWFCGSSLSVPVVSGAAWVHVMDWVRIAVEACSCNKFWLGLLSDQKRRAQLDTAAECNWIGAKKTSLETKVVDSFRVQSVK